jgi:hypothetical protein
MDMELEEIFGLFLEGYLSSSFEGQLTFFLRNLKILEWFKLTCFHNTIILVLYMINPFFAWFFEIEIAYIPHAKILKFLEGELGDM